MKIVNYIIAALALLSLASSCKKDEYFVYTDVARIQFGPEMGRIYDKSYNLADTLKPYTFYYSPASSKQDTVFFDIYAIGGTSKKDRAFKLEQVQLAGANNAVAGTHYKDFNDASVSGKYVIKAGQIHAFVPVVVLRDASLKTSTAILKLKVVENDEFKLGEPTNNWRKVEFTDRLSQPAAWTSSFSQYYFGAYSVVKHQFLIEQTGQRWDQTFINTIYSDPGLLNYWKGFMKVKLVDYNNAHPGNPLKDENGVAIVFP